MIVNVNELRGRRATMGYTMEELAKQMGLSRPNLSKKMKDESGSLLTLAEAIRLCIILKIKNPGEYFYAFKERQSEQKTTDK